MDLLGKKIMVTGGTGFLGSFLCEKLREKDPESIIVPESRHYDLTEERNVKNLYSDFNPSIVIHLAADVGGIGKNQKNPGSLFYNNLVMGTELMEYGRKHDVDKFVAIGTVCSYPSGVPVPFREENLWDGYPEDPNASFGMAKKMLIVQSRAYRKEYGFNSINLLPTNLYGPRDNFDLENSHVIPAMIRKFNEATKNNSSSVTLWGSGDPTREFLFVEDAAEAILRATQNYSQSQPVNLGTNVEVSIKRLAKKIKDLVGFKGEIKWDTSRPDGQSRRSVDTSRAKKHFGFEAETPFDKGLKQTVEWYRDNHNDIVDRPALTGFKRFDQIPDWITTSPD